MADNLIDGGTGRDTIPPEEVNDQDAEEDCEESLGPEMLQGGPILLSDNLVGYRDQRFSLSFFGLLGDRDLRSYLQYYGMTESEIDSIRRWRNLFLAGDRAGLAALVVVDEACGCGDWSM